MQHRVARWVGATVVWWLFAWLAACSSAAPTGSPGTANATTGAAGTPTASYAHGVPIGSATPAGPGGSSTLAGAMSCPLVGGSGSSPAPADVLRPEGTWFGMGIDWGTDSVAGIASRLGSTHTPAAWVQFVEFPIRSSDRENLDGFYGQVRSVGGIAVLTLQPNDGLAAVTPGAAESLARLLAGYRACGVPTIVRFAHEMNGTWYPWGQDPAAYVAAFRTVADAVHRLAPGSAMMWAPNGADGYPFAGGRYEAKPGSAAFDALDTNHDGRLTAADDPYAPYWPGDDVVDWVGMSLYHWGNSYPWGANDVPPANKFREQLTGAGSVTGGTHPDFYATYATGHGKPMAIVETAAFWRPDGGGAPEQAIKQAWWRQVFSGETAKAFPLIHLIGWFEWRKVEAEVHDVVDWRLTGSSSLVRQFLADLPAGRLRFAPAAG